MARAPRCFADPAKQAAVREEIRKFGPVAYMVEILQTPHWDADRVPELSAKLMYAARMLDKVSANLRHYTVDATQQPDRDLSQHSDAELIRTIAERRGIDVTGKGTDQAH